MGLLAGFAFILKLGRERGWLMQGGGKREGKRLQIVDSLLIDPRRRLVLVRKDQTEHLLLLGPNNDIAVETNLLMTQDNYPSQD